MTDPKNTPPGSQPAPPLYSGLMGEIIAARLRARAQSERISAERALERGGPAVASLHSYAADVLDDEARMLEAAIASGERRLARERGDLPPPCQHGYAPFETGYSSCVFCPPHPPGCKCNGKAPCPLAGRSDAVAEAAYADVQHQLDAARGGRVAGRSGDGARAQGGRSARHGGALDRRADFGGRGAIARSGRLRGRNRQAKKTGHLGSRDYEA
jgi:hypothetical protein